MNKKIVFAVVVAVLFSASEYGMAMERAGSENSDDTVTVEANWLQMYQQSQEMMNEFQDNLHEWGYDSIHIPGLADDVEFWERARSATEKHEEEIQEALAVVGRIIKEACKAGVPDCAVNWWKGDADTDGDGILNSEDNCAYDVNPLQEDTDIGDRGDVVGDGVGDRCDNCVGIPNPDQMDLNDNGSGDVCEVDTDGDGVRDLYDNCRFVPNTDQADFERDGRGDACESTFNPILEESIAMQVGSGGDGDGDKDQAEGTNGGCRLSIATLPTPSNLGQIFFVAFALAGLALGRASRK